jgi:hypothetical protein
MPRYALVIGIDTNGAPLKSLSKTAGDARAIADLLEERGNFVKVERLIGTVTQAQLEGALQKLLIEQAMRNELTIAAYEQLNGVVGSLNAHAESIYKQLVLRKQEQWMKRVMLRLVRTGEGMRDTRQRQLRSDLSAMGKDAAEKDAIESVINDLVNGRLLVIDRVNEQDLIDLSHEALMRSWKRFVEWREGDPEVRRLVQQVNKATKEWLNRGKDSEYLIQGGVLTEISQQLYGQIGNYLSPLG